MASRPTPRMTLVGLLAALIPTRVGENRQNRGEARHSVAEGGERNNSLREVRATVRASVDQRYAEVVAIATYASETWRVVWAAVGGIGVSLRANRLVPQWPRRRRRGVIPRALAKRLRRLSSLGDEGEVGPAVAVQAAAELSGDSLANRDIGCERPHRRPGHLNKLGLQHRRRRPSDKL
jgi:hypothetical protein